MILSKASEEAEAQGDCHMEGGGRALRAGLGWEGAGSAVDVLQTQNGRRAFAGEWTAWHEAAERAPPCQLLITLIGVIS